MAGTSLDLIQGYIYYFGVWEPNLTAFIARRLHGQSERTFVDVGANVGYFSLLAATSMPTGNVVSIEAFPSIYDKLRRNIELNHLSNIRTIGCAATEAKCEIDMFHAGPSNEGGTTTLRGKFATTAIKVRGQPLSELLSKAEVETARLIKIDVEGAEFSVIQGMRSILKELPLDAEIVVEITPDALGGEKMAAIFEWFRGAGYFPYTVDNPYAASHYLGSRTEARPRRLRSIPTSQTDCVFSRTNSETL